jgi:phage-related protein
MLWNILLYETNREEKPVEKFIESLSPSTVAKTMHMIDLLEEFGLFLSMPHSKKLMSDIYELRIRGKEEIRILYSFQKRNIYLLHIFKKKSQKTPAKELNTALGRFKSLT